MRSRRQVPTRRHAGVAVRSGRDRTMLLSLASLAAAAAAMTTTQMVISHNPSPEMTEATSKIRPLRRRGQRRAHQQRWLHQQQQQQQEQQQDSTRRQRAVLKSTTVTVKSALVEGAAAGGEKRGEQEKMAVETEAQIDERRQLVVVPDKKKSAAEKIPDAQDGDSPSALREARTDLEIRIVIVPGDGGGGDGGGSEKKGNGTAAKDMDKSGTKGGGGGKAGGGKVRDDAKGGDTKARGGGGGGGKVRDDAKGGETKAGGGGSKNEVGSGGEGGAAVRVMALFDSSEGRQAALDAADLVLHEIYPTTVTADGIEATAMATDGGQMDDGGAQSFEAAEEGIVAALMSKDAMEKLAKSPGVVLVEFDAEVKALSMPLLPPSKMQEEEGDVVTRQEREDKDEDDDRRRRLRKDDNRNRQLQHERNDRRRKSTSTSNRRRGMLTLKTSKDGEVVPPGISLIQADDVPIGEYVPRICLVDTGYGLGHRDLPHERKRTVDGRDVDEKITGDVWEWGRDPNGHGTHTAGIVAAIPNNGVGVRGVLAFDEGEQNSTLAPTTSGKADLFVVPGLDDDGEGHMSDVLAAVSTCVENGANVVSLGMGCSASYEGGTNDASCYSEIAERFLNRTVTSFADILIVAPAGDDGGGGGGGGGDENGASERGTRHYPASYDSVVSVTSVAIIETAWAVGEGNVSTKVELRPIPADFAVLNPFVDLAGPGVDVLSSHVDVDGANEASFKYATMSGSSQAAAHVAGAAALVWSYHPRCSAQDVWEALWATSMKVETEAGGEGEGASDADADANADVNKKKKGGKVQEEKAPQRRLDTGGLPAMRLVQVKEALENLSGRDCAMSNSTLADLADVGSERGANDEDGPWTECEGMDVEGCLFFIREAGFTGKVVTLEEGAIYTMDFDETRVRIFYNEEGIVENAPFIG